MYDFDTTTRRFISKECRDIDGNSTTHGERYLKIWDFMIFDLGLSKSELLVYAQIFAMYKNFNCAPFKASKEYLAKWCNSTVRTVLSALNSLEKQGCIVKIHTEANGKLQTMYCIDFEKLPTCRAFSKENYFANQINKYRDECRNNGRKFDKAVIYRDFAKQRDDAELEEFSKRYVQNRDAMKKENEKIKNYYKTQKSASSE